MSRPRRPGPGAQMPSAEPDLLRAVLADPQPGDSPTWVTRFGRERELLERYRAAWEKPLRDLFRPAFSSPGRWLKSHLFGSGGLWGFHRGVIEHVLAPAPTFLAEDVALLTKAPIRRVVLAH